MYISTLSASRCCSLAVLSGLFFLSGCLNPGMQYGYGYPGAGYQNYGQPMYAPPQMLNPQAPGTLVIPESNAPAYDPSKTYESNPRDPSDDFRPPGQDNRFFEPDNEEGVPTPRGFGDDLGVQSNPDNGGGLPRPSTIQPVSATSAPLEYGFDTENYTWLRGVLRRDAGSGVWSIEYSPAARDRFGGQLYLTGPASLLQDFGDGAMADVHGRLDETQSDDRGRPLYRIDSINRVSM